MSIKVLNNNDKEVNVLHFQGKNVDILWRTFALVKNYCELDPIEDYLSLVSCWTDNNNCYLYQQLKKNNIELINALPYNYDYTQKWNMINKIKFYIDCLENRVNTKYVMLLDGYDVLFTSTKDILKKFKKTGYRIIFNTSYNNYPEEDIDYIENREEKLGFFHYFNAGCCIGYREDLIRFYKECLDFVYIYNPLQSEQKVLRHCFAKYSNDKKQKFIWLDYKREIFHTMALTTCSYDANTKILKIDNNYEGDKIKRQNKKNLLNTELTTNSILSLN